MPDSIEQVECTTAEEMLLNLSRRNSLWGGTRQFWVFRGHSNDDNYRLVPSSLRINPPAILGYSFMPLTGPQPTNAEQKDAEFKRLHEFYWSIDAQGLNVPGDGNFLRTPEGWRDMENKIKPKFCN